MSLQVGWPEARPEGQQKLAPISSNSLAFTRAMESINRNHIVLELGARNGWYTGVLLQVLGPAGKVFSADDVWNDPKTYPPNPFDTFIANRWDDKERLVPLRGGYSDAMRWIHENKGTVDHIVISNGSTQKVNMTILRLAWAFFPKVPILGNTMILDPSAIAVKSPAGGVYTNHRTHFEWTPAP